MFWGHTPATGPPQEAGRGQMEREGYREEREGGKCLHENISHKFIGRYS